MKTCMRTFCFLALVLAIAVPAIADTIKLKDGSVIRGQVIGFKDQQFTVLIGSGAQGRRSRTLIYMEDVESIEFDSATTAAASALANDDAPTSSSTTAPVYQAPKSNPQSYPTSTRTNNDQSSPISSAGLFTIKVAVRADDSNNGWTTSGYVVKKGQRIRVTASGRVFIGAGQYSTPDGVPNLVDAGKLIPNQPTGALIAVIGDDNDDFIFIGRDREIVAARDGILFLGLNEGNLKDNVGTYDANIQPYASSPAKK